MNARYDLLLKGGEVLDPARGPRAVADVAFKDGRVAAVGPDLDAAGASKVLDVSGKVVTPGLIDVHGHYFPHVTHMGISADSVCLPNGVTTTMDAGSSGWAQFDAFKEFILRREKTRLFALINLSSLVCSSSSATAATARHSPSAAAVHRRLAGARRGAHGPALRPGG